MPAAFGSELKFYVLQPPPVTPGEAVHEAARMLLGTGQRAVDEVAGYDRAAKLVRAEVSLAGGRPDWESQNRKVQDLASAALVAVRQILREAVAVATRNAGELEFSLLPQIDPKDVVGYLSRREIRDRFAPLDDSDKNQGIAGALKRGDAEFLAALRDSPEGFPLIPPVWQDRVYEYLLAMKDPDGHRRWQHLEQTIAWAEELLHGCEVYLVADPSLPGDRLRELDEEAAIRRRLTIIGGPEV